VETLHQPHLAPSAPTLARRILAPCLVDTRGIPPSRRVAGQQAGACRWRSWPRHHRRSALANTSTRCCWVGALSVSLVVGGSMPAFAHVVEAPAPAVLRPTLPPPTGNLHMGVVPLHLVDRSRPDPWVSSQPVRELMVSVWYPARRTHAQPGLPVAAAERVGTVRTGQRGTAGQRAGAAQPRPAGVRSPARRTPLSLGAWLARAGSSPGHLEGRSAPRPPTSSTDSPRCYVALPDLELAVTAGAAGADRVPDSQRRS
jgi:hypothetical protein